MAKLVGMAARRIARDWDAGQHPSQVRAYGPDGSLTDLAPADWDRLAAGPALLFVHGTFSSTEGAFGRLPSATMAELHRRYGGRVIAFDHPTLADDPFVNARAFFDIVGDRTLDVDIVCHSRGGLVARSIAERPGDLAPLGAHVRVRQIAMVGVLNAGTILADAAHWSELLDRYTTLLRLLPAPGIIDTLETVLAVVKAIAVEVAQDLEGLAAMAPGSEFLGHLNVGPAPADGPGYRVIGSDFEPIDPDLKAWLNDEVRDKIFAERPNDMMVTIDSMAGANGSGRFPIAAADIHAFAAAQAVEHADYFGQPLDLGVAARLADRLARLEPFAQDRGQLIPFDQERVVALGRVDLAVARVDAGRERIVDEGVDLALPVQDVVHDADAGQARPAVGQPGEGAIDGRPSRPRCRGDPWPRPGSGRSPGRTARRACGPGGRDS